MATKAEVAAARADRRAKAAAETSTTVNANDIAQGSHVVITPAGNANILPKPSPEIVSVHALPGNLAQKTDYLGNLYPLPSDQVVRRRIQDLADRSDRPHLEAAVALLENQFSGPQVDHRVPNSVTGEMEYFTAGGEKIDKPKVIPPPTFVPAKVSEDAPASAVSALPSTATKAEKAAAAKADKEAKAKAKKDAVEKAKADKAAAAQAKKDAKAAK